jgi:hypothetical protein
VHRRVQTIHLGEDLVGRFGPGERLRIGVVLGDVAVDRSLQVDDRVKAAALEAAPGLPTSVLGASRASTERVEMPWT